MESGFVLQIAEGQEAGRVVDLSQPVEIGRDSHGPQLKLDDTQVSGRHARVSSAESEVWVEDLASANGTYVNGEPIHGPRRLVPGDTIRVGHHVIVVRTLGRIPESEMHPVSQPPIQTSAVAAPAGATSSNAPPASSAPRQAAYAPPTAARGHEEAERAYEALNDLVDSRQKERTILAGFALPALAAVAVIVYLAATA